MFVHEIINLMQWYIQERILANFYIKFVIENITFLVLNSFKYIILIEVV